jgi:hypothetical protein
VRFHSSCFAGPTSIGCVPLYTQFSPFFEETRVKCTIGLILGCIAKIWPKYGQNPKYLNMASSPLGGLPLQANTSPRSFSKARDAWCCCSFVFVFLARNSKQLCFARLHRPLYTLPCPVIYKDTVYQISAAAILCERAERNVQSVSYFLGLRVCTGSLATTEPLQLVAGYGMTLRAVEENLFKLK